MRACKRVRLNWTRRSTTRDKLGREGGDKCEAEQRKKRKQSVKENVKSTSPQKSFLLCFSLVPVESKMMTAATRKWFPSPAACLCVNTFNYTTLNSAFPFRMKDRCGSQPASLNQVQERRRPLKAHQSESYLPLGRSESGAQGRCFSNFAEIIPRNSLC